MIVDREAGRAVERVRCPIEIVRVERGLLDEPSPLVPLAIIDELVHGPHTVTTVADLNHYTVIFDPRGARSDRGGDRAGVVSGRVLTTRSRP